MSEQYLATSTALISLENNIPPDNLNRAGIYEHNSPAAKKYLSKEGLSSFSESIAAALITVGTGVIASIIANELIANIVENGSFMMDSSMIGLAIIALTGIFSTKSLISDSFSRARNLAGIKNQVAIGIQNIDNNNPNPEIYIHTAQ